jgi:hypothetical protein
MIPAGTPPDEILSLLGITEPEDIDIEAIGFACGATILKEPLTRLRSQHYWTWRQGHNHSQQQIHSGTAAFFLRT